MNSDKMNSNNPPSIPEFDHETLLDSPALAGKLTAEEFQSYSDDPESLIEAIQATASVLSLSWSTDSPGGSGALHVHRWHGLYFLDSLDWGLEGPVASLAEILADERFQEPCPTPELASDELSEAELLAIARKVLPVEEATIAMNGVPYIRTPSGDLARATG